MLRLWRRLVVWAEAQTGGALAWGVGTAGAAACLRPACVAGCGWGRYKRIFQSKARRTRPEARPRWHVRLLGGLATGGGLAGGVQRRTCRRATRRVPNHTFAPLALGGRWSRRAVGCESSPVVFATVHPLSCGVWGVDAKTKRLRSNGGMRQVELHASISSTVAGM